MRWAAKLNELSGTQHDAAGAVAIVGDRLVIGQADGRVRCVELATGDAVWTGNERHTEVLQSIDASPDGRLLATAGSDRLVRVWDAASGAVIARHEHPAGVWHVRFAPDGARVAVACTDDTVTVHRPGHERRVLTGHEAFVTSVDWSPRGDRLVSVSYDATLRLWDAETGGELVRCALDARSEAVAWSGLDQLAVGLEDGSVSLREPSTLIERARLRPEIDEIHSLRWSASGRRLAAGGVAAVVAWDHRATRALARFPVDGYAHRVAWSADATLLAASLLGDRVRLWNVPGLPVVD